MILEELETVAAPTLESGAIKEFTSDERIFYGRVDKNSSPIVAKSEDMIILGDPKEQLFVFDFVAEAFESVRAEMAYLLPNATSAFLPVTPRRAYVDPAMARTESIATLQNHFLEAFAPYGDTLAKVKDFKTFFPIFSEYALDNARQFPLNMRSFMLTRDVSVLSSGLAIEIYDGDYSDDSIKKELFYSDENFPLFEKMARMNGFAIDKHIPWRLVAELESPNMLPYLSKRYSPATTENVMAKSFESPSEDPMLDLMRLATDFYNAMAIRHPVTQKDGCRSIEEVVRTTISYSQAESAISEFDLISLYVGLLNVEINLGLSPSDTASIADNAFSLSKSVDRQRATGYINNKFNTVEHFNGSLFSDIVAINMSRDPDAARSDVDRVVKRSVRASKFKTF